MRANVQNRADLQRLYEFEVLGLWEATAKDDSIFDRAVVWWWGERGESSRALHDSQLWL